MGKRKERLANLIMFGFILSLSFKLIKSVFRLALLCLQKILCLLIKLSNKLYSLIKSKPSLIDQEIEMRKNGNYSLIKSKPSLIDQEIEMRKNGNTW